MIKGSNGGTLQARGPDVEIKFHDGTMRPFSKHALKAAIENGQPIVGEGLQIGFLVDGYVHFFLGTTLTEIFVSSQVLTEISSS